MSRTSTAKAPIFFGGEEFFVPTFPFFKKHLEDLIFTMVVIKLHRNEDLLRFTIDDATNFASFEEYLKKFYLQDVAGPYELKYRDDEQDMVWLTSKEKVFSPFFRLFWAKKKERKRKK
jgi:hypothetical protein